MSKRNNKVAEAPPWKLLLWTAVAGLVFGLIGFGEIAEDWLRVARNSLHRQPASGQIVLLTIDDRSLREIGNWPWPRKTDAELIDRLTAAGAKRIFFDVNFSFRSNPDGDAALAKSIERSGRVTLLVRTRLGTDDKTLRLNAPPLPQFAAHAKLGVASVPYNYQNAVWRVPYAAAIGDRNIPSFAASLANVSGPPDTMFPVDYSIDVLSIPAYSAGDVLTGRVGAKQLAGKDVLIGIGTDVIGDSYFIPGYGKAFGVHVHAIGAETLKQGKPLDLGWIGAFLFALAAAAAAAFRQRPADRYGILGAAITALLIIPVFLEARLIFVDVVPAMFVMLTVGVAFTWRRYRTRGLVNTVSGLPNLNALRTNRTGRNRALIAARVLNYEEILATLPPNSERKLVDQITSRLTLGAPERTLYQGDGGIFAWFEEPRQPLGNHLEALYALFRNPARVGALGIDLSISFGVEVGSGRSLANRLAARWSPPKKPRTTGSSGSITTQRRSRTHRGSCRCSASSTKRSTAARCGSPISPSSSLRPCGSSAPRRWRAGPTPKRARSPQPSSSPPPNSTTASASSPTSCLKKRSRRPLR